jgi:hypothetical protein
MKVLSICSVLVSFLRAKNYILVPRDYHVHTFNYDSFAKEHKLEVLVKIGKLSIYKTDVNNYNVFSKSLQELFEIEEDKTFTLPKPIVEQLVGNNSIYYIQNPGDEHFQMKFNVPWHLDRVVKHELPLNNTFEYDDSGSCHKNKGVNIHTYVVDTGIDVEHPEFEGRAKWLANFADDTDTDCNSHGTHCAGLVGSKSFGVCKDAQLFAVKVLNCQGSGTYSGILSGLEFVHKRHEEQSKENPNVKSVISMSLGGGFSRAINRAVEAIVENNSMYVVVAAGNEDSNACRTSPASARGILTIMASDKYDNRAYFSNYGSCADLYSPGVNILSTIPNGKTAVYSGTSMATPVLVGVLNHYLDEFSNLNMRQVKNKMMSDATKNKIQGNPSKTNNLFVYLHREN